MNMKNILTLFLICLSLGLVAQNASFGIGASMNENITIIEEVPISIFNGGGSITTIEESRSRAMTLKTALTTKIFTVGGLTTEAII